MGLSNGNGLSSSGRLTPVSGLAGVGGFSPQPSVSVLLSSTAKNSGITISNGGLTATAPANATHRTGRADFFLYPGTRTYWEFLTGALSGDNVTGIGVVNASMTFGDDVYLGSTANGSGYFNGYDGHGSYYFNGVENSDLATYVTTNVICVACHAGVGLWFRVNNGNWNNNASGNPSTGVGGFNIASIGIVAPAYGVRSSSAVTGRFSASAFTQAVPSGYSAPNY